MIETFRAQPKLSPKVVVHYRGLLDQDSVLVDMTATFKSARLRTNMDLWSGMVKQISEKSLPNIYATHCSYAEELGLAIMGQCPF